MRFTEYKTNLIISTFEWIYLDPENQIATLALAFQHPTETVIALFLKTQQQEKAPKQHHADTNLAARLRHLVRSCVVEPHASNSG